MRGGRRPRHLCHSDTDCVVRDSPGRRASTADRVRARDNPARDSSSIAASVIASLFPSGVRLPDLIRLLASEGDLKSQNLRLPENWWLSEKNSKLIPDKTRWVAGGLRALRPACLGHHGMGRLPSSVKPVICHRRVLEGAWVSKNLVNQYLEGGSGGHFHACHGGNERPCEGTQLL